MIVFIYVFKGFIYLERGFYLANNGIHILTKKNMACLTVLYRVLSGELTDVSFLLTCHLSLYHSI